VACPCYPQKCPGTYVPGGNLLYGCNQVVEDEEIRGRYAESKAPGAQGAMEGRGKLLGYLSDYMLTFPGAQKVTFHIKSQARIPELKGAEYDFLFHPGYVSEESTDEEDVDRRLIVL
jgi:hypothetical protein